MVGCAESLTSNVCLDIGIAYLESGSRYRFLLTAAVDALAVLTSDITAGSTSIATGASTPARYASNTAMIFIGRLTT